MHSFVSSCFISEFRMRAESSGEEPETTTNASSETTADSESDREPYTIPELDLGGETFTILNPEKNFWDCYTTLDVEEETGEILDDAVFRRNVALEELFNFEFEIVEMEFGTDLPAELSNVIMSGVTCTTPPSPSLTRAFRSLRAETRYIR